MQEVKSPNVIDSGKRKYLTHFWHVPSRNINFTGREALLEQIGERLFHAKPLVITACYGLGGVGKTQLVTEYVYRNQDKYERVLWIPAENAEQIEAAYLSLGQDLKIIPEKTPPAEAVAMVKTWLSNHPRNLVIFDNVPDYQTVEPYILSEGADVLITSRHTEWPEKGIEVDVFSLDEAVEYYQKIVGIREGDAQEKIEKLAKKLGQLPLAMAQAAAYIHENKISIEAYLDIFKKRKKLLLSKKIFPEGDEHEVIYVTWDVTMEKIREKSVLAPALLNVCSYLHSENIPALLLESIGEDERFNLEKKELFEEARGYLASYSMVSVNEEDYSISVHRLVQDVIQAHLNEVKNTDYIEKILNIFWLVFPYNVPLTNFRNRGYLLKHLKAVFEHSSVLSSKGALSEKDKLSLTNVIILLSDAYGDLGLHFQKKMMLEHALLAHPATQEKPYCYFYVLLKTVEEEGETKDIIETLKASLVGFTPSPENPLKFFMDVLYNVASLYGNLGKHVKKAFLLQALLEIKKIVFPDEDESRIKEMSSLGRVMGELGKYEAAETLLLEALSLCRDDKQTARVLLVMGTVLGLQPTRHSDAKSYLTKAISYSQMLYGNEYDEEARALNHLGYVCACLGEVDVGMSYLKRALAIHERDKNQAEIMKVRVNIGFVYGHLGDYVNQKTEMQNLLDDLSKMSYDKPKFKADALVHLANAFYECWEFQEAFDCLCKAHEILRSDASYGPCHPSTVKVDALRTRVLSKMTSDVNGVMQFGLCSNRNINQSDLNQVGKNRERSLSK